jgi:hypothetical protein
MAKARTRGPAAVAAARFAAWESVADMETPLREVESLLVALELIGAGLRGRGDEGGGEAVSVVADCALTRIGMLKKQWNRAFRGSAGAGSGAA